jgi:hypothetical protein
MAKQDETVLDAINEALGTAGDSTNTTTDDDAVIAGDDDAEGDVGADESEVPSDDDADEEGDGEGGEEGGDEEGEEGAEDDAAETPEAKAAAKALADAEAAKKGEKKPPDAINDPIPKDLKQETRQRMQTLIETAKTVTAERDKITSDFNMIVGGLQNAGVSPEQYGETLSWLAMFNSGDPVQQAKALDLVEGIADRLATLLGRERTVNDPLKDHPDLQQAITNRTATREIALEVARTRNAKKFQGELATNASAEAQRQTAAQQELQQARTGLTTLETTLRATDPQYERKKALLVPVLKPVFKSLPPSQWGAAFKMAYDNIKLPGPGRPLGNGRPALGQQPMRAGKNPAGGHSRQASSPLEALNGALNSMGK